MRINNPEKTLHKTLTKLTKNDRKTRLNVWEKDEKTSEKDFWALFATFIE